MRGGELRDENVRLTWELRLERQRIENLEGDVERMNALVTLLRQDYRC